MSTTCPSAISEAARVLVPGGQLAIAIVPPINSAGRFEPATQSLTERDRRFVVNDSYFAERRYADDIERDGLFMRFESMHRPIESYTRAIEDAGFAIEAMREIGDPDPDDKWSRLPLFLDLRAARA